MTLRDAIDQYIAFRQAQGAHFTSMAGALRSFARSAGDEIDSDTVANDQADAFLARGSQPPLHSKGIRCVQSITV